HAQLPQPFVRDPGTAAGRERERVCARDRTALGDELPRAQVPPEIDVGRPEEVVREDRQEDDDYEQGPMAHALPARRLCHKDPVETTLGARLRKGCAGATCRRLLSDEARRLATCCPGMSCRPGLGTRWRAPCRRAPTEGICRSKISPRRRGATASASSRR